MGDLQTKLASAKATADTTEGKAQEGQEPNALGGPPGWGQAVPYRRSGQHRSSQLRAVGPGGATTKCPTRSSRKPCNVCPRVRRQDASTQQQRSSGDVAAPRTGRGPEILQCSPGGQQPPRIFLSPSPCARQAAAPPDNRPGAGRTEGGSELQFAIRFQLTSRSGSRLPLIISSCTFISLCARRSKGALQLFLHRNP